MKAEYRIISPAMEVLIRADNGGSQFVTYTGFDHQSIMKQIEQDSTDGKIALLMPPVHGYLIEFTDIPGVRSFVNETEIPEL